MTFQIVNFTWKNMILAPESSIQQSFTFPKGLTPIGVELPQTGHKDVFFGTTPEKKGPDIEKFAECKSDGLHIKRIWLQNNSKTEYEARDISFKVFCIGTVRELIK